jgi:hypothetical protein
MTELPINELIRKLCIRRIGTSETEMTRGWRKLHKMEVHNFHSSRYVNELWNKAED